MSYKVDPRKNWAALDQRLATETDPIIRRNIEITVAHSKAEARADFPALMATVSDNVAYTSFTDGDAAANSPKGKAAVAAYYKMIVESGCHYIEHAVERIVADRNAIATDGNFTLAYPTAILKAMGHAVSDDAPYYLYTGRLMIVWGFDADGLVTCEDSYAAGDGFNGIGARPCRLEDIYRG
ncbi:MAG TPA: hypothetical protein VLC91_07950 [Spongiibacteraceae bacterium]|nr:hypothetical protein [Spongiibacteraceae bacterium]